MSSFFFSMCVTSWASCVAVEVKNSPASAGGIRDDDSTPGSVRSLEEGTATQFSILACENSMVSYNPLGCKELGMTEAT